jgi:DtxR family transcriptional regulator, Mn-dependent transcriptional regulator
MNSAHEDYLKAIYDLERVGRPAATSELASHLGVAPASVTGMVRRLAEQGLVTHERYHGVRLTAKGRLGALRTLRRHRVLEAYLVQVLGYRWDEVHEEAERLEHAASDDLIDRMALAIGEPTVDPHGAPIPSREGAVDEADYVSLLDVNPGTEATIMRIADEDPDLLRHVAELTLTPGSRVKVVKQAPFDGPITLDADGELIVIGRPLAQHLLVKPLT